MRPSPRVARIAAAPLLVAAVAAQGIQQTIVATQLDSPVAMAIAADGRVFVTEQGGAVRVVVDDVVLPQPFVVVPTVANDEEGLTGIALDPAFAQNGYVYLRVTEQLPTRHNRVWRYTASGNTAVPGSATPLFDLETSVAHFHLGSALHFGTDGKLYLATGDNDTPFFGGSLGSLHGKMLRLNADGSIPADNPFFATLTGDLRAIYALGIRNTFTFAVHPQTGAIFGNDVGSSHFEEINAIQAGGNYGWPGSEGPSAANLQPLFAYPHSGVGSGCAVTAGTFYAPAVPQLGAQLVGKYLFTEYCRGELRVLDPQAPQSFTLLANVVASGPVDIATAPDGAVYYLTRGNTASSGGAGVRTGAIVKITAAGAPVPSFTTFGNGCAGTRGVPYVQPTGAPHLGSAGFTLRIGLTQPSTIGALQLGFSNTAWSGGPLPLDLSPLGMPTCRMLVADDLLMFAASGAGTEVAVPIPIPSQTALVGVPIYLQGLLVDLPANAFGAVVSAGAMARIGL